jgi:hypothetical protein
MAIDKPTDKIRELAKDPDFDASGAALQFGSIFSPAFKVFNLAKGMLDSAARTEKVLIAIRALCDEFDRVDSHRREDIEDFIGRDWFKKAVVVLVEEAARAPHEDRARLLARVAAHGCFPTGHDARRQQDLASYIHDLARLGEDDVQMLRLLRDAYKDVFKNDPNLRDPNRFTHHNETFKHMADELNIHADDRLALGARLSGFGLAFESVAQMEGHFFRLTLRGIYLLSLLEAAALPMEKQN